MSDVRNEDLKQGTFDTWATNEAKRDDTIKTIPVKIDHKAATRQAVIVEIRRKSVAFKTRSEWKAKQPPSSPGPDWHYKAIAIHHAGNSFSCSADGLAQLQKAEATDIDSFGQLSYHYAIDCKGVIYEAPDIRCRGAHIEGGNTGVIGIVFLGDLSVRGEVGKHGPGAWNVMKKRGIIAGMKEWLGEQKDLVAVAHDEPTEKQLDAAYTLVKALLRFFDITTLGGHREFSNIHGSSRACPGVYGMIVADAMRRELKLKAP